MCSLFVPCCSKDLSKFHLFYHDEECIPQQTLKALGFIEKESFIPVQKYRSDSWDSKVSDITYNSSLEEEHSLQKVPLRCAKWKYSCPNCQKRFERPSTLKTHMNSHTGERPFSCPNKGCGRSFTVRSNMMRHHGKCRYE